MHRLKWISFLTVIMLIVVVLMSCASEAILTGGAKDTQAPSIIKYSPINKKTHFASKRISIDFDEYIKIKGLQKELILSPPINPKPKIEVKGKSLIITLDTDLLDSTTYTIYMGNAIVDITEGNSIPNFKYVFSTGKDLDSLSIKGSVIDAFSSKPVEEILVMLYKKVKNDTLLLDSIPLLRKPIYLSKTDKEGRFHIENIAEGTYLLFALQDENRNYLYDLPTEKIAFSDSLIIFDYLKQVDTSYIVSASDSTKDFDSTKHISMHAIYKELRLFREKDTIQKFLGAKLIAENKVEIAYKVPLDSPRLRFYGASLPGKFYQQINKTKDSIFFWFSKTSEDSLSFTLSDKTLGVDSLRVKISPAKNQLNTPLRLGSNVRHQKLRPDTNLVLYSNYPIDSIDTKRIIFFEDSLNLPYSYILLDTNKMLLSFDNVFLPEKKYELNLLDSAIYDLRGMTNDSIKISFTKDLTDAYGAFLLHLKGFNGGQKIIELLQDDKVIERRIIRKDSVISYKFLLPGEYQIRCTFDDNNNNKWDVGDYLKKIQPERIIYFNKAIKLRASWELEEEWKLNKNALP